MRCNKSAIWPYQYVHDDSWGAAYSCDDVRPAVGIDLGTTYSCVALWQHDQVEVITNDEGNRTTPYISFADEERLIGDLAKNNAPLNPTNTVYEEKNKRNTIKNHIDVSLIPESKRQKVELAIGKVINWLDDYRSTSNTERFQEQITKAEENL